MPRGFLPVLPSMPLFVSPPPEICAIFHILVSSSIQRAFFSYCLFGKYNPLLPRFLIATPLNATICCTQVSSHWITPSAKVVVISSNSLVSNGCHRAINVWFTIPFHPSLGCSTVPLRTFHQTASQLRMPSHVVGYVCRKKHHNTTITRLRAHAHARTLRYCTYMLTPTHACTHTHTHTHTHTRMHAHTHARTRTRTRLHACIYTYAHIH